MSKPAPLKLKRPGSQMEEIFRCRSYRKKVRQFFKCQGKVAHRQRKEMLNHCWKNSYKSEDVEAGGDDWLTAEYWWALEQYETLSSLPHGVYANISKSMESCTNWKLSSSAYRITHVMTSWNPLVQFLCAKMLKKFDC